MSTYVNFLQFLDNDDRMSSKRRNLSALVFLINSTTKANLIRIFVIIITLDTLCCNVQVKLIDY